MIKIAGAGVSGLTAGLTLLKGGEQVQIYEKESHVGIRPLEVKAIRNYDVGEDALALLKRHGIRLKPDKRFGKVIKYSPDLYRTDIFSRRKPIFYTVKCGHGRGSIHNELRDEFFKEGGRMKFNSRLKEKDADIVATGSQHRHAHVVGGVYDNLDCDNGAVYLFYNNKYAPGGYVTILPHKDGLATILMVSFFSNGRDLKDRLRAAFNEIKPLKDIVYNARQMHLIDGHFSFDVPSSLTKSGRLIVGGRAGLADFSRAFGLKNAIISGNLAAESILNGHDYDTAWKHALYNDIIDEFKNRIKFHRYKNKHLDKYHRDMGSEIFLDHYSKKRKPKIMDHILYPMYRFKWSLLKTF